MLNSRAKSMSLTLATVALSVAVVSGCRDDYLNNRDTVSMTAGSAMRGNAVVHTIDPWPASARKTHQTTDGRKAQNAIEIYRTKPKRIQQTTSRATTVSK